MVRAIDIWCNPFTPEAMKKFTADEEIAQVIKWWGMEDRWLGKPVDQFLDMMDDYEVDKVFIPSAQIRSYQRKVMMADYSMEEIYDIVSQKPDRLKGLYGINPFKRLAGVKELETAVTRFGFIGAHIHCYGFERAINHRDYWPYYAKCVELDIPVVMQVGHSAEAMPSALAQPILIDDIALYFPELRIVGAHTGWPWVEELIAMAWKHPNVFIGTSMHYPKYWPASLITFLNSRGMGKVLFGSDYPGLSYREALEQIGEMGLKEKAAEYLLRKAALQVFKLE